MSQILINSVLTTEEIPLLELNRLVRNSYIREGKYREGNYQAKDGDPELFITSDLTTYDRFIVLRYDSLTGANVIESKIKIAATPSNLGKGNNIYFICPVSGKRAKILYFDFLNQLYVHRESYSSRVYYPLQVCSKFNLPYERGYIVQKKLLKKLLDFKKSTYKGEMTGIHKKIEKLMTKERAIQLLKDERDIKLFERRYNSKN